MTTKTIKKTRKNRKFDLILFNALDLNTYSYIPSTPAAYLRYVFVGSKPTLDYPVPAGYEEVFDWTWTYKVDSNVIFCLCYSEQ